MTKRPSGTPAVEFSAAFARRTNAVARPAVVCRNGVALLRQGSRREHKSSPSWPRYSAPTMREIARR